jgi:hypothetical protein
MNIDNMWKFLRKKQKKEETLSLTKEKIEEDIMINKQKFDSHISKIREKIEKRNKTFHN